MTKQPLAIWLANELDAAPYSSACTNDAANELRRLHALCEEQKRLLEHAIEHVIPSELWSEITKHLRQHEGAKHDRQAPNGEWVRRTEATQGETK